MSKLIAMDFMRPFRTLFLLVGVSTIGAIITFSILVNHPHALAQREGAKLITTVSSPDEMYATLNKCKQTHTYLFVFCPTHSNESKTEEALIAEAAFKYKGLIKFIKWQPQPIAESGTTHDSTPPYLMFFNPSIQANIQHFGYLNRTKLERFITLGLTAKPGTSKFINP